MDNKKAEKRFTPQKNRLAGYYLLIMNTFFTRACYIAAAQLIFISVSNAQAPTAANTLQEPPAGIAIDGDIKEWGDSLRYYNADKQLNYSLANDKENLYMAIRINDRSEQMRLLNAGLTFGIDTHGKKKESFSLTFPYNEQGNVSKPDMNKQDGGTLSQDDRDELVRERLTKLRQIKVTGFKDIEDEIITTSNTYGIKIAIDYDKDGYLIYEAAIPLKFFHANDIGKNEWAFDFKINGIKMGAQNSDNNYQGVGRGGGGFGGGGHGGGGHGGHGGGGHGGQHAGGGEVDHSELSKSVDFWEKFFLARG